MYKWKPVGLIAAGRMTDSALARHPALTREIEVVAAASLRLASRYANVLKTGRPGIAGALADCRLVVIHSPALELRGLLELMLRSGLNWRGRAVALLNDELDSGALDVLVRRHACVCATALAPTPENPLMVAEGEQAAIRAVRGWASAAEIRFVELRSGTKQMYAAGLTAAEALITPILDTALRSLRAAGLSTPEARRIVAHIVDSSIRGHHAHGRKTWPNPASPARRDAVRAQLAALETMDERLALFQRRCLEATLELYGQPFEWLEESCAFDSGVSERLPRIHTSALSTSGSG